MSEQSSRVEYEKRYTRQLLPLARRRLAVKSLVYNHNNLRGSVVSHFLLKNGLPLRMTFSVTVM